MIRFQLALAGILIVPALAPAEDPKPPESPRTLPGGDPRPNEAQTFYLDSELIPFGSYQVGRPGAGWTVRSPFRPSLPAQADPLQANFGLQLASADDALRAQLEIPPGRGVVVVAVLPGGLAEQAGLKPNDVLIKLGDKDVDGVDAAKKVLLGLGKDALEVKLIREGKPGRMSLVGPEHGFPPEAAEYWIGVPVSPVDATLRSHLPGLEPETGLIANDVVKASPAEVAGLLKNDILVSMGGKPLRKADSLIEQIQATKGQPTPLLVLRAGKSITLNVTPARRAHPTTINLPGDRSKLFAYQVIGPQVAVEVAPQAAPEKLAGRERLQAGLLNLNLIMDDEPNAGRSGVYPNISYDAIIVNPHRVDGSDLRGTAEKPLDIRLRMVPRRGVPQAGDLKGWELITRPDGSQQNPYFWPIGPEVKYDAIVVNPHRVAGADLAGAPGRPSDVRVGMAPKPEPTAADATARIEARLDEISARLEEIRKAIDAIKK